MASKLHDLRHRKQHRTQQRSPVIVRQRWDAAQTTNDNIKHWAGADGMSADAAASAEVRRILRERARYEVANNSYARGIVDTLANDVIGTGPRLQMMTEDAETNSEIEYEFSTWASEIRLADKLRTMRKSRSHDGESFAIITTNPKLKHGVKLDLQLIEADQVASDFFNLGENETDGVKFDTLGNPASYRVLRQHPGGANVSMDASARWTDAGSMIHVFREDRPGQHRGIPEITPALPLFALLRRFTLAVIHAAESAANFAGILYTDAPAGGEADNNIETMDPVELERNMLLTMPHGWKMATLHPEQPATTYAEFKREILNEIARCLNMPFNIAAGNSSGYNYASGRLDHQTYHKSIGIDQSIIVSRVLMRVFAAWLHEYKMLRGKRLIDMDGRLHQWFWDGMEHVDPNKEASAQEKKLKNGTTTLAYEYARQGRDWEVELHQLAREKKLSQELGLEI